MLMRAGILFGGEAVVVVGLTVVVVVGVMVVAMMGVMSFFREMFCVSYGGGGEIFTGDFWTGRR